MNMTAVGFYWTRPVPWAGFTQLPSDINEAATISRTIAYQRSLTRRYAQKRGYRLVGERTFIEIEPDRGSDLILGALDDTATSFGTQQCTVLLTDFAVVEGMRAHWAITDWAERHQDQVERIYPEPMAVGGEWFDPFEHFRNWRELQQSWKMGKSHRTAQALTRIADRLQADPKVTFPTLATLLNEEGLRSVTGMPWTGDSVRKFWTKWRP